LLATKANKQLYIYQTFRFFIATKKRWHFFSEYWWKRNHCKSAFKNALSRSSRITTRI